MTDSETTGTAKGETKAKGKGERGGTRGYVVLESPGGGAWDEAGVIDARSAADAVQIFAGRADRKEGYSFVAVPERSWHPMRVEVETVTRTRVVG